MSTIYFPKKTKNLTAGTSLTEYVVMGNWIPAIAVKDVKTLLGMNGSTANFSVTAALQVASVDTNAPGAWTNIGSFLDSDGANCSGVVDVSTQVDGNFWVRFGVGVKSSGSTFERGQVTLAVSARSA